MNTARSRIWRRAVEPVAGASLGVAEIAVADPGLRAGVDAIFAAAGGRTRLLVVSHITSPTAVTLPVEPIVAEAKRRGILVCIDGPHAIAQLPLELERLGAISIVPAVTNGSALRSAAGSCMSRPNTTPRSGRRSSVGAGCPCAVGRLER